MKQGEYIKINGVELQSVLGVRVERKDCRESPEWLKVPEDAEPQVPELDFNVSLDTERSERDLDLCHELLVKGKVVDLEASCGPIAASGKCFIKAIYPDTVSTYWIVCLVGCARENLTTR